MNRPLDLSDLKKLEGQLKNQIDAEKKYWRVNEVKCNAIYTAQTYEEFSDRVAAAHLRPLEKSDHIKSGSCKTVWNTTINSNNTCSDY